MQGAPKDFLTFPLDGDSGRAGYPARAPMRGRFAGNSLWAISRSPAGAEAPRQRAVPLVAEILGRMEQKGACRRINPHLRRSITFDNDARSKDAVCNRLVGCDIGWQMAAPTLDFVRASGWPVLTFALGQAPRQS